MKNDPMEKTMKKAIPIANMSPHAIVTRRRCFFVVW